MRRTSSRKAAVNRAKLLKSIRATEEHLFVQMMETLEDRSLFSLAIPAANVGTPVVLPGQTQNTTDHTPSVAIDLNNPLHMAAVWQVDNTFIKGAYSADGGKTWAPLAGLPTAAGSRLRDPNVSTGAGNALLYQQADSPTVGIDRDDQVYVTFRETNADGSSGAVVLRRYDFSGATASPKTSISLPNNGNKLVYQWIGDQAVTPIMAVDNNVPLSTDKDANGANYTQSDDLAGDPNSGSPGNVYIAWMTNDVAPTQPPSTYNPYTIRLIASSDGGASFSTPVIMNDDEHSNGGTTAGASRPTKPRLAISQGTAATPGGQVTVVWDDIRPGLSTGNVNNTDDLVSDSSPAGAIGLESDQATGPITDAVQPTGTPTPPPVITPTPFTLHVNGDSRFNVLTDLDLTLAIKHAALAELKIELQAPNGQKETLVDFGDITGADMGIAPNKAALGTTLDDSAARSLADGSAGIRVGHFVPTSGFMSFFNGLTRAEVTGDWTLTITDNKPSNAGTLLFAKLNLTSRLETSNTKLTFDVPITSSLVRGSITNDYPRKPGESPDVGVGPDVSIASDNTLGAYSAHQGRLYVTYLDHDLRLTNGNKPSDTRVYFAYSDDFGQTWTVPTDSQGFPQQVARDTQFEDGFTQGLRPQLQPEVAVDQATGMLVVQLLDTRNDAAEARVTTNVVVSNDGGQTFSKETYLNNSQQVVDAITGKTINLAPIPDNSSSGNGDADKAYDFGDHQGLAVYMGHVQSIWTSNVNGGTLSNLDNRGTMNVRTNSAFIAAGPRVVEGTQGAVGEVGDTVNNSHASDGTPQLTNFVITFDRPVDPATFDATDVTVQYRDANTPGTSAPTIPEFHASSKPTPLDTNAQGLATQFLITIPTQTGVGTYIYTIGPDIGDHMLTYVNGALVNPGGNRMDQSVDGSNGNPDDAYADNGQGTNLPLIIPGPHVVSSQLPGQTPTGDNLFLNTAANAIEVTFDRDIDPSTFTSADVLGITTPSGTISSGFTVTKVGTGSRTFRITFTNPQTVSGSYLLHLGPNIADTQGNLIDRSLNAGLDQLRSIASKDKQPVTYNSPNTPVTIGANQTITSKIPISDAFKLVSATVQLNITFPTDSDLEATLIAPDGTQVPLFKNVRNTGSSKANFNNTIFDDLANTPINSGGAPYFGRFQPQIPLAKLISATGFANGTGKPGDVGNWTLQIKNDGASVGTLVSWNLTLVKPVSLSGLGEDAADRTAIPFRVFTMDKGNSQSSSQWTPLGPTDPTSTTGAGRISSIVVDPSDPSGNTVFVAGSGGGIWKTTNFLTHDAAGPRYAPLTDFGPTGGLTIGSIAVFARNNDPSQTIVFASTGDGNVGAPGVGFIRSMDGGKTWVVLDSKTNFDASGNLLPIVSRKHEFVGTTSFKVIVDPQLSPTGDVVVYAALSDGTTTGGGGVWRSQDTGRTWTQVLTGNATDVLFDYNSVGAGSNNLSTLFAAVRGKGVFISSNRGDRFDLMAGGVGDPLIQAAGVLGTPPVAVVAPASTPQSGTGRIVLAKPALVGDTAQNLAYEGFLYAAVGNADGTLNGLYVTKDFGQNWTKVQLPNQETLFGFTNFAPTNDDGMPEYDVTQAPQGRTESRGANYAMTLAVDPTNANIIYFGGSDDRKYPGTGFIRIDITGLADPHAEVVFNNSRPDGGALETSTKGRADESDTTRQTPQVYGPGPTPGTFLPLQNTPPLTQFVNLIRNPDSPFDGGATLQTTNIKQFNNDGIGATYIPFDRIIDPRTGLYATGRNVQATSVIGSNQHALITMIDPATGLPRLLIGTDQGVFSMVDDGGHYFYRSEASFESAPVQADGTLAISALNPVNASDPVQGARNGDLQLAVLNYGAVSPSTLSGQIAEIFGSTEGTGIPRSAPDILTTGNIAWNPDNVNVLGKAVGVAVSQQDPGTGKPNVYAYYFPSSLSTPADFFQVNGVTRTFGLIQDSQTGEVPDPQWPYNSQPAGVAAPAPGNFTVNPINGDQILISSAVGRVFSTEDQGRHWSVIADPTDLDSSYVQTLTYGAPDPNASGSSGTLNNYLLAGTKSGNIFVTFTGGGNTGANAWKKLSNGLDGSPVMGIVANPVRGTHDAYAVTQQGVYFMADTRLANPSWINITGNLKQVMHTVFNDPSQTETVLKSLSSMVADWRYLIPDVPSIANSTTHPVLYIAGTDGVFRSTDKGATWKLFPNMANDGSVADGGYLPSVPVNDLDLSLGYINPTTGQPNVSTGEDLLVASTGGRGSFGIRVAPQSVALGLLAGGNLSLTTTPTITGYSEQTAFGNTVHVKLYDVTNPSNRVFIGEADTDGAGKFTIPVSTALSAGSHTLAAQATDDAGLTGPDGTFTFMVTGAALPKISISPTTLSLPEGNSGTKQFNFTVSLDQASATPITVTFNTADGTATVADNDYQPQNNKTLTFAPGVTSLPISILVNGDTKVESDETFSVTLSGQSANATIGTAQAVATITNDDVAAALPNISITDVSKAEGNTGTTTGFTFTVSLDKSPTAPVTLNFATSNGTATAGSDYTALSGPITFGVGETTKQITVNVTGDTTVEPDETFFVNLSGASGGTITKAQGLGTIVNDDGAVTPTISINDVTKAEGNSAQTAFTFNVTLSSAPSGTVTVQYATADGTASSASDYQSITNTLTFAPGDPLTKQITVLVNGDTTVEPDETFSVNLSNPTGGATISDAQGLGTIVNDDVASTASNITIADITMAEGNSGNTAFVFTVLMDKAQSSTVTVKYATANGSALSASDYQSISDTLTFAPGETSKQITVNVNGDTTVESDETFFVNLSNVTGNAVIADNQAKATITNDDGSGGGGTPSISIGDLTLNEGNSGQTAFTFNVALSSAAAAPVTVNFATADGSATAGSGDYTSISSTPLTFAPGETSKQITVFVNGDTTVESNETFFVNLSGVSANATIADNQAVGTITNDDAAAGTVSISSTSISIVEGNSGTKQLVFTVQLSGPASGPVTVDYATSDAAATVANKDYVATSGTLTFAPGEIAQQVKVTINGDTVVEPNELFNLNLKNPSANATIATPQVHGTILDDDAPSPSKITINNVTKKEGNSGSTTYTFTVTLDKKSSKNVTVKYATANGTASSSSDYTSKSGTLTFTPGQTSKTISITVKGDTTQESDESFFVNLSSAGNGSIVKNQGVGLIQNDDKTTSTSVSVITDPTDSSKKALQIFGTNSADTINVTSGGAGKAIVTINGSNKGTFAYTGAVIIFGQDGNDKISVDSAIASPVYAFGGFGDDVISGGSGAGVLQGEAGNDTITGNGGRDLLVGGDGKDSLSGGADDDVLMPGDFNNATSFATLASLRKEITRLDADYATRVGHLMNGGGFNTMNLNATTCFSSITLVDTVTGGTGNDFFLAAVSGDVITDKEAGETVTDIGTM